MIKLQKADFWYKKENPVIRNLSLELSAGKIYGLLGLNGAGKTTLLKLMAGTLFPKTGSCTLNGLDSGKRRPEILSDIYFLTDEVYLPDLKISEFVKLYNPFYSAFSCELFKKCINEFGISYGDVLKSMSYGQKKKVLISFAIATNTSVLLMDEPTNGLDIPSKSIFRKLLASYASVEKCIVISTHQVRDLEMMLDQFLILHEGKMIINDSVIDISNKVVSRIIQETDKESDILYREDSLKGSVGILRNNGKEDTKLDIELFFNAAINQKEDFLNLIN